jgi:hypothetical protein
MTYDFCKTVWFDSQDEETTLTKPVKTAIKMKRNTEMNLENYLGLVHASVR